MSKKALGIKTKGFVYSMLISAAIMLLLSILLLIFYIVGQNVICLISSISGFLAVIFSIYKFISNARVPKVLLEYDDKGIYLNSYKDTIFVHYSKIESVYPVKTTYMGREYEYGNIEITTKDDIKHKVGIIYDVVEVAKTINDLIVEKREY